MMCFSDEERIPYKALVIIESPMLDKQCFDDHLEDRIAHLSLLEKAIAAQRSKYDSREAAYEWISKRGPWKVWDDRSRQICVVRYPLYI